MKAAVLLTNRLRTFKQCGDKLLRNVVEPLAADVFLMTWDTRAGPERHWGGGTIMQDGTAQEALALYRPLDYELRTYYPGKFHREGDPPHRQAYLEDYRAHYYQWDVARDRFPLHAYDLVFRTRFDVLHSQRLTADMIDKAAHAIVIPAGNEYGGHNDAFAFGPSQLMKHYLSIWPNVGRLAEMARLEHPETMLGLHLQGYPVATLQIGYYLQR